MTVMHNAEKRRRRMPGWLTLGLAGLVALLTTQWARPGADFVLSVVGAVMMISAVFWARFWVSHRLLGRRRLIPATKEFGRRE